MDLTLREGISLVFILIGTIFLFSAGLGIVRMPDLFLRMSMTTKGATFGVGSILLASIVYFDELDLILRSVAVILFMLLTAPVSAHMIGRAGYLARDVALWEHTHTNDLEGRYDLKKGILASQSEDHPN